jgi:hypothetical protein
MYPLAAGKYILPPDGDVTSYLGHLRTWPLLDEPELFGFHANANITFNRHEARRVIDAVLSVQPRMDIPAEESSINGSSSAVESGQAPQALASSATNNVLQRSSSSSRQRSGGSSRQAHSGSQSSSSSIDTGQQQSAEMQQLVEELIAMLPAQLASSEASILRNPLSPLSGGQVNPLGVTLQQEMDR